MFDSSAPSTPVVEAPPNVEARLLMVGLWRRRLLLCLAAALSLIGGLVAGKHLGKGSYVSETTLLYDPEAFHKAWDRDPLSPSLLASRVKSPAVLTKTAERLHMPLATVEQAAGTDLDRDSGLLHIRAESKDPAQAQQIARTLCDVFTEDTREGLVDEKQHEMNRLRTRYSKADEQVAAASLAIQRFLTANGVSAGEMTLGQPSGTIEQLQLAYTEALTEASAMRQQATALQQTIAALGGRVGQERFAAQAAAQASNNSARSQALLAMIEEDRARQANTIAMRQAEVEMKRSKELAEKGYIARQDYERAREAYEKNRALVSAGPSYKAWRDVSSELSSSSASGPIISPSESMIAQLQVQAHSLQVQAGMLQMRAARLQQQYQQALEMRRRLPGLQSKYAVLAHKLEQAQAQRTEAETALAKAERAATTEAGMLPGLTMIADADLPSAPMKSRGKLIGAMVAAGGIFLSLGLVVLMDLQDKRLKAPTQFATKLSVPVLGAVPRLSRKALAAEQPSAQGVDFEAMARRLREQVPASGARVLLVSPGKGEGKSLVAQGLAHELEARRQKVLLLDTTALDTLPADSSKRYDLILVDGTSLEEAEDRQRAGQIDAIVLVVQNHLYKVDDIRTTIDRLNQQPSVPVVGTIVTMVDPMVMRIEPQAV